MKIETGIDLKEVLKGGVSEPPLWCPGPDHLDFSSNTRPIGVDLEYIKKVRVAFLCFENWTNKVPPTKK